MGFRGSQRVCFMIITKKLFRHKSTCSKFIIRKVLDDLRKRSFSKEKTRSQNKIEIFQIFPSLQNVCNFWCLEKLIFFKTSMHCLHESQHSEFLIPRAYFLSFNFFEIFMHEYSIFIISPSFSPQTPFVFSQLPFKFMIFSFSIIVTHTMACFNRIQSIYALNLVIHLMHRQQCS